MSQGWRLNLKNKKASLKVWQTIFIALPRKLQGCVPLMSNLELSIPPPRCENSPHTGLPFPPFSPMAHHMIPCDPKNIHF